MEGGLKNVLQEAGKSIVVRGLWPTVKPHFDNLYCFDNIQVLKEQTNNLQTQRDDVDQKIKEAERRVETTTSVAGHWSQKCTQQLDEAHRILQSYDDLNPWNIIQRYLVGREGKKTAEGIAILRDQGNSITISHLAHPVAMGSISREPILEFESRSGIEEDIMESLNGNDFRILAICGAAGVGKTTMVRKIEDRVRKENLFDEVVHVVVSQQIDTLTIQKQTAKDFGLDLSEENLAGGAHKLHIRLVDSKRKLIVFDGVWKKFNLTDLGVPFENDCIRCKIILLSRIRDTCKNMGAQKILSMDFLTKKEARTLFIEKSGSRAERREFRPIAEEIVAECKVLPIALVNAAEALKDKSIHVWRDLLFQLKRSIPSDYSEVIDAYMSLKLSYDFLENASAKSIFLLCSLFPENHSIPIELLTLYSLGLGMFEDIGDIEGGRSRTHSLVETLKSHFLLINGRRGCDVKMNDVFRDMAIFIGSKDGFLKSLSSMDFSSSDSSLNCNWMSLYISTENTKPRVGSKFPELRFLMIRNSHSLYGKSSKVFDANFICPKAMKELNVLSFTNIFFSALPPALELLKKLTTLHLDECAVKDISVVGKLASLEILRIDRCNDIDELPMDISRLNLRVLELSSCEGLKRIEAGFISSMDGLEELKIINCFDKWKANEDQNEENNACLSELESLTRLTSLQIEISDCNLVAEDVCLSNELVRYRISLWLGSFFDEIEHERSIALTLPKDIIVGNWIRELVRRTESLVIDGDGSNLFETESLRKLTVYNCPMVKKLVKAIDCRFPELEALVLKDLTELEEITDGAIPNQIIPNKSDFFPELNALTVANLTKLAHLWDSLNQNVSLDKLISISISECPNLRYLFSMATARSLAQLEELDIQECNTIENVFGNELGSNTDASIEFPKLKVLKLQGLPNITAFSQGVETIEFPQLTELEIRDCPRLRTRFGKCPKLRSIQLSKFNGLHHLLSSCFTRKWNVQLRKLLVNDCGTIEEILWDEIEDGGNRHIIFPELKELELCNLPCLTTFYKGIESIKFPKLRLMRIGNLPMLNSLLPMDSETTHDDHCLHFFCNPKVEIPGLEILHLADLGNMQNIISKIWCHHISINFFRHLKQLYISNANGIKSLVTSSIAKNLVNLKTLNVEGCHEMVDVIEDEEDIFVPYPFPNLEQLNFSELNKLRRFCQWKYAFDLPLLRTVEIVNCPMETFTLGSLSTPKLSCFHINGERVQMKGLNDHFRTKSQVGKKRKGTRGGREEEKRRKMHAER